MRTVTRMPVLGYAYGTDAVRHRRVLYAAGADRVTSGSLERVGMILSGIGPGDTLALACPTAIAEDPLWDRLRRALTMRGARLLLVDLPDEADDPASIWGDDGDADPARIDRTLAVLLRVWSAHPYQRLGQLLLNAASLADLDLWAADDADWAAALEHLDDTLNGR